jgi:RNA polymerase sigma-70 factor (ECF subfamily)
VARAAEGDATALAALYDRHGRAAYALARAMVGGASDAEDVVASTFSQLWQSASRYDAGRGSVAAWITTMTRSRALDLLRAQRRRTRLHERAAGADADGFAVPLGGGADLPDREVERAEVARVVRASLETLPPAQRTAIELAFFGGLSHTDIAQALDEPLGTVKTRIRSGMLKLRDALRPLTAGGAS